MSRDADEPRPPKRPGSRPRPRPTLPDHAGPTEPDGPSTFRPNPARLGGSPPPEADSAFSDVPPRAKPKAKSSRRTTASPPTDGGPGWVERIVFGRVSTGHLVLFCRQFGAYADAGVPLLRSLDSLHDQFARTALGPVIERVALGVRRGDSLSDAMRREPQAFDAQFLSMMAVAEARGGVPETMKRLAASYESRQRLFRQARSAMIYPTAVILIAFAVGMLLTVFVLPGLLEIIQDMIRGKNIDLPWTTSVLMGINKFMISMGWFVVPLVAVGTVVGLIWLYRRPRGKAFLDEIVIRLPVLGKLFRMIDTARLGRTLGTLLEAGVDVGSALALTADTLMLVPLRRAVRRTREAVMDGAEMSEALRDTRKFTPDVLAILNSGEETGKLPETLERMAADYEERVELMVKNLGNLIQPLIFIILGGVVLFIAIAFFSVYVMLLSGIM